MYEALWDGLEKPAEFLVLRGGDGEDTVSSHGGADVIDLGEDAGPGAEDFDTVRYDMSAFVQDLADPGHS